MISLIRKLVSFVSNARGAKITLAAWIFAVVLLSMFAPSAKKYEVNSAEGSVKENTPSEIASALLQEEFQTDDGMAALVVFHKETGLKEEDINQIEYFSEWLQSDDRPEEIAESLPFHLLPPDVQQQLFSEDHSTLILQLTLHDIQPSETHAVLKNVTEQWEAFGTSDAQIEITGPAGIVGDTITLFKNADVVLILATVGLIFIILIVIYRSPFLAIIPLIIAGMVYAVVDRILGLLGKYDVFVIEGQATSIMLVLLFAVVTDYSLFIFARYREELRKHESKYEAMNEAIYHVSEPIFFSGGTIILAMLTLFVSVFKPYHYFAPVFSVAVFFILVAGLTLVPAMFALLGRKAFWPLIPKKGSQAKQRQGVWSRIGKLVTQKPRTVVSLLLIVLLIGAANIFSLTFSFNMLKSFPEDISSRVGFEILEENYPAGELAPVTVLLTSDQELDLDDATLQQVQKLQDIIAEYDGISTVKSVITDEMIQGDVPLAHGFVSETGKTIKFPFILDMNPYEPEAIEKIKQIRDDATIILTASGFSANSIELHFAGQTANQLDVKEMNRQDMMILFSLVTVFLTIALGFQTRSILLPVLMMGTILLSYIATLGFSWLFFHQILNYDAISYRIPVYTFVFMVALGIDYNIMLVSRIKEFSRELTWVDAIKQGVTHTGGVISSAGLILAATFSVLMTQPIQELFLFGTIMAFGILLDTFIIRGLLLPALLLVTHSKK